MFFRINDFWVFCWGGHLCGFYNFIAGMDWLMRNVNRSIRADVVNTGEQNNACK